MTDSVSRLNAARVSLIGLALLVVFVVLSRGSSGTQQSGNTAQAEHENGAEASAGAASDTLLPVPTAEASSAQQTLGGTAAPTPAETDEPQRLTGCFRSGSSRAEVRAAMGAPDTVDFGAWLYGRSNVTFGYGVVLDYSNQGDNLRLC